MVAVFGRASARILSAVLAPALIVAGGFAAAAPAAAAVAVGSLSGVATDEYGAPADGVYVVASSFDEAAGYWVPGEHAITDASGAYTVSDLQPGAYRVGFFASGSGARIMPEWWEDAETAEAAADVIVTADETTTDVSPELPLAGRIAGVVTDGNGAPVQGVSVTAISLDVPGYESGLAWAVDTTEDGSYTIDQVPSGDYKVQFATVGADASVIGEWWDDAADEDSAAPVSVAGGSTTQGIGAQLALGGTISGTVTDSSGNPVEGTTVHVTASDASGDEHSARTDPQGRYAVRALPADDYIVRFDGTEDVVGEWWDDAQSEGDATALTVAADAEITGISPQLAPVVAPPAPVVESGVPTITGVPRVGGTLSVTTGPWTDGATLSYQWLANGAPITGATGTRLLMTTAHRDKAISVRVTGVLAGYDSATVDSAATAKVATVATPTIAGTPATGSTLTASPNTWTASTTFAYQWFADGVAVSGATKSSFVPSAAQDGAVLTVRVTGSRPGYATVTTTSKATAQVLRVATPTITGTVAYNSTLKVDRGVWSPGSSFAYQWYADGAAISGAKYSTLKLTSGLKSKRIAVKVTGSQPGYATAAKISAATGKVTVAGVASISGTPVVGAKLSAQRGTWASSTSFSYQWYADGAAISGATGSTLTLSSAREHDRITVKVTGRKTGYATVSRTSSATSRILRAGSPSVSGSPLVTRQLTASAGSWTSGTSYSYQWYANGSAIRGATSKYLKVGSALVGKRIAVKVTGRLSGYPTITKSSAGTGAVGYPSRATPSNDWNCPSWAPIKGNESSMIYHLPGQRYYNATNPEECFRTESAARAAGYRAAKI